MFEPRSRMLPETGEHFDLTADPQTRNAIAKVAGLRELPRLEASFDVNRQGGGGLRVAGRVAADWLGDAAVGCPASFRAIRKIDWIIEKLVSMSSVDPFGSEGMRGLNAGKNLAIFCLINKGLATDENFAP